MSRDAALKISRMFDSQARICLLHGVFFWILKDVL